MIDIRKMAECCGSAPGPDRAELEDIEFLKRRIDVVCQLQVNYGERDMTCRKRDLAAMMVRCV